VTKADALYWLQRGHELKRLGDLAAAREAFLSAASGVYGQLPAFSQAGALRTLGELAEHADDVERAITYYRGALEQDPKVGVQKRLHALEGRLARRAERRPGPDDAPASTVK
jgi:tetratricopeptide (TPR) repeat protein